jgi:hypothetical protein
MDLRFPVVFRNDAWWIDQVNEHDCFRDITEFSLDAFPVSTMVERSLLNRKANEKVNRNIMDSIMSDDPI